MHFGRFDRQQMDWPSPFFIELWIRLGTSTGPEKKLILTALSNAIALLMETT
jgi:hypothetical protein